MKYNVKLKDQVITSIFLDSMKEAEKFLDQMKRAKSIPQGATLEEAKEDKS